MRETTYPKLCGYGRKMKLLKPGACHSASGRGNDKGMTVMGDAIVNWLSDRGSIPLSSIICGKEVALIMPSEEQKEAAIDRYVDLMRIKAYETGENKELDYQIKVAKVKLSSFGIDYSELEF